MGAQQRRLRQRRARGAWNRGAPAPLKTRYEGLEVAGILGRNSARAMIAVPGVESPAVSSGRARLQDLAKGAIARAD